MSKKPKRASVSKGDVLAQVDVWTVTANIPGYSLLVQYDDGKQRFLTHEGAQALIGALLEALRADPPRGYPVEPAMSQGGTSDT